MTAKPILFSGIFLLLLSSCGGDKVVVSHFDSGKLKSEWHINSSGQKHGIERQYFATGELLGVVKWVEDQMDSVATYYWKNENPRKRVEYNLGQPSGTTTWFHKNGQPEKQETYLDGVKNGTSTEYFEDGNPKSVITYEENYREGVSKTWFPNGKQETLIHYRGGQVDGEYIHYHESGEIKSQGLMRKGEKSGLWREYDEEGREIFECVYSNDRPNGAFSVYFPASGKVKALGECKDGRLNGQVIVFTPTGQKIKVQNWKNGDSDSGTNDLSWFPSGLSIKAEELVSD